jgi:hypothetical protein
VEWGGRALLRAGQQPHTINSETKSPDQTHQTQKKDQKPKIQNKNPKIQNPKIKTLSL